MNSLSIVVSNGINSSDFVESYSSFGSVELHSSDRLVVIGVWGFFSIEFGPHLMSEYSDEEVDSILKKMAHPEFVQIDYRNVESKSVAIWNFPYINSALVENERGEFVPLSSLADVHKRGGA